MNHFNLRPSIAAFAAAGLFLIAQSARAVVVPPGSTLALAGTTVAAQPELAGVVLEDELLQFSLAVSQGSSDLITGTVQQRVVREDGSGTLDFYWRITEVNGGSLGYLRVGNFVTETYDANYRTDGLGSVAPTSLTHFTPPQGGATSNYFANFNFVDANGADTLGSGQQAYFVFLHTDATRYAKTAFFDIASTGTYTESQSFAAFTPAVPEPASFALFLAGLGLTASAAARRRHL
jgi:hypothetical protein